MRRYLKILAAILFAIYLADVLLKKFFLSGFYAPYALPETASYLCLFFSVGAFLLAIVRLETEDGD